MDSSKWCISPQENLLIPQMQSEFKELYFKKLRAQKETAKARTKLVHQLEETSWKAAT